MLIEFPETLPVSGKRGEITQALSTHQVIIVCGETGSGKTTQLPKIALALGRGQRGQKIGHTQPRRIAAASVAKRIAQELNTPLGEVVGYKVRFTDRVGPQASIKLMTDGILLAETQTDPLLKAYDTLIIDEAHERSLNIDFLLGYLRQLLPRRPDLKVVITSATIDAQRFADYFASTKAPAPVILVSGRMFPVEQRYRPFEESREYGINDAIADAIDELWRTPTQIGDVLVFLPGEREIREAADHLRRHLSRQPLLAHTEVVPLFARLSQAEQDHIFEAHHQPRIVLATNVAETSLTVPGIKYVVDAGLARVKRYSFRSKVEQLLVEPISQAAANQRAGRCGRVAEGVCIRLYEELHFLGRPRFTDPEILRSSLAAVILRMKALGLGAVEDFAFIDPPSGRAIADGYQLLTQLGALGTSNELTPLGQQLAKLPLDPCLGRMILEGIQHQALDEVLVIASALSVQDVRDRPLDKQAAADQAQAQFDDAKSEFVSYLKLWKWLNTVRGGGEQHKLSNRQYEQMLREHFINPRRVREWRDVYSQLLSVVKEQGWQLNPQPASYEQLHLSLLTGLLGNIGCKSDDADWYLGARGVKFYRHPGAKLNKRPGRWVMCAELVETTRLFGRGMATIEPQWVEKVAGHLLNKQLLDPHWEKKSAQVVALERATLYGLVIYNGRRTSFGRIDPAGAREIFIRQALVASNWETKLPFLAANQKLIDRVQELEHKSRRQDVLVDEELIYAFYDQQLPAHVCSGASCEAWYRLEAQKQPHLLHLSEQELMRHQAAGITTQAFPAVLRLGGVDCAVSYLHQPGDAKDGVTVEIPLFALNQVSIERCQWLVPGMLAAKVQALLKTLHQKPRAKLVPLSQTAARMTEQLLAPERFGAGSLVEALLGLVRQETSLDVKQADFKLDMLSPHLFMHFRVVDADGRQLGTGRDLGALKSELGSQARGAFAALAGLKLAGYSDKKHGVDLENTGEIAAKKIVMAAKACAAPTAEQRYTSWSFGVLPELMEISQGTQTLIGFPALVDQGDAVSIEVFDETEVAAGKHRQGLRRLFALQLKDALKYLEKNLPDLQAMSMAYMQLGGTAQELRDQVIAMALERAFLTAPLPTSQEEFEQRLSDGRGRLNLIAQEVARLASTILAEFLVAQRKVKDSKQAAQAVADITEQLQRLLPKHFLSSTPYAQLQHFPRYLKGITLRLNKWRTDPERDNARMAELRVQEQRFWRLVAQRKGVMDARLQELRWLLEELRVSFFAQELRTPQPVSVKRIEKVWGQLR